MGLSIGLILPFLAVSYLLCMCFAHFSKVLLERLEQTEQTSVFDTLGSIERQKLFKPAHGRGHIVHLLTFCLPKGRHLDRLSLPQRTTLRRQEGL